MKKINLLIIFCLTILAFGHAQLIPQAFNYSAVARNSSGLPISNSSIGIQISILKSTTTGSVEYSENHVVNTDDFGLFNLVVGGGAVQSGSISTIDWSNDNYFLEVEMDVNGGTNFQTMGVTQLLSVPYALHAKTAESIIGTVSENDPVFTSSVASGITGIDTAYWNNKLSTEIDGSITNEIQTISRAGTTVTLSNGGGTFEDSIGVYIAGQGIDITNNIISTTSACGLSIGDSYQGGIIFYLDASGCHGLICAPTDQSTGIQWHNGVDVTTYSDANGIGAGFGNTIAIRKSQGSCPSCYAASLCLDLNFGDGYRWYLPSKYELSLMYSNIGPGNALGLGNIGNFASDYYWSSSEGIANSVAWFVYFSTGSTAQAMKSSTYYVRAVSTF